VPVLGLDDAVGTRLLLGGRQRLPSGSRLFAEQHLRVDGGERQLTRAVGGDVLLAPGWSLSLSYERGALDPGPFDIGPRRDAASLGTVWADGAWSVRAGIDGRTERRDMGQLVQAGATTRVDWRASDTLTLALAGRGASTYGDSAGRPLTPVRGAWEGAVGFALRPVDVGPQALGRYAVTYEREAPAAPGAAQTLSHVGALTVIVPVATPVSVSPKLAYRFTEARSVPAGAGRVTDHALLLAVRGDWHVTPTWDLGLEGRRCSALGGEASPGYGVLAEASVLTLSWLRVGAGYNFSDTAVATVRCREPGARGAYVRVETLY
jgi:hypothetical protein